MFDSGNSKSGNLIINFIFDKPKITAHNRRLARLRILQQIHVLISQEVLSLTEKSRLRSSQPRQATTR